MAELEARGAEQRAREEGLRGEVEALREGRRMEVRREGTGCFV
jgi:hypothetical protein